ncbi:ABC transporter substrate-binding protein [Actimicrobium sp. CCI2.3]|uniref:ABC transporter substrate-binding protein n=1 Tax=Actimicrobium sp. CCI2.3 TaxID=3048616 RepID=UPI002AB5C1A1|nr:ABC transporter substrate-binding protein [Actimicrobium sp. CCI2.3]MDY7574366.1 ABC transporter substrate-binding protein [Actimicrobium sp. CCI2.3]MEB0023527.1 ABC transporter substrate-binding protein [Actimicrobium sp. CCI2.3]
MKRFLATLLSAACVITGWWTTHAQAGIGPASTIRIGVSGPFTGGSGPLGESMRNGVRLAIDEINRVGGINGQLFELIERDDQASVPLGAKIADDFVQEKVTAVIGIVNTGVGLASIDAYQKASLPLLVAVSTGTMLTRKFAPPQAPENYIFRISPTVDLEARALASELKRRKIAAVSLLADTTPYGDAGALAFREECQLAGIALRSDERFKVGDTDMRKQVARARQSRGQALVAWGIGPELAVIARNKAAAGWTVPLLGSWTFSSRNFIDSAGPAGEGALMPQTFIQDMGSTTRNGFLLAYRRLFKTDLIASPMSAAQGYDGMHLLYRAIRQANSGDGRRIRAALENLESRYQGVITSYSKPFSASDHDAITLNMLWIGRVVDGRVDYSSKEDQLRDAVLRYKKP